MAKLGAPVTNAFKIGTAEFRLGQMSEAMALTQTSSVGLVDNVVLEVTQESVDLLGGFPQSAVDTAIVSQVSSLTATAREYSGRNVDVMLGNGITAPNVVTESEVTDDVSIGGLTINVSAGDGTKFNVGDLVSIYPDDRKEEYGIHLVESSVGDALTFDAGTPLLFNYNGTSEVIKVFKTFARAIGGVDAVHYASASMTTINRQNNTPDIAHLWKVATASGLSIDTNATDFASFEMSMKGLLPSAAEYGAGGDLEHLKNVIPRYPAGLFAPGGDIAA